MKKFKDPHNKHLRRYILLSVILFALMAVGHIVLILKDIDVATCLQETPELVNYGMAFIGLMMLIMGIYYYRATKK